MPASSLQELPQLPQLLPLTSLSRMVKDKTSGEMVTGYDPQFTHFWLPLLPSGIVTEARQPELRFEHLLMRKQDWGDGCAAPCWKGACQQAYGRHILSRAPDSTDITDDARQFLATVRNAKKTYWRNVIDGVKDDTG
ncbi:hypothetical protein CC78DRAFT_580639 [Lojkania enalia]|uniref:Uncharacterized protein n=1 Tax=Lojkania enalia TaxID=147567 RepID=A0A9P4N8A0_9PLEO|nr:hypothetical protein CC78DRAFT_580639 [Didymosphaeria enalia]